MSIQRQTKILEFLATHQRSEVTSLAELFNVSQVTLRKDLVTLEERGLISREHGYASLSNTDDIGKRLASKYDIKRRIAQEAAAMVDDGETVMISSGSCCTLLAEELANSKKNVTIITNSVFIANFIRKSIHTKIILLGGFYQQDSQVLVGPITRKCGEVFFSDKFFIGADGFKPGFGFTGNDHLQAQTVTELAENACGIYVLTDSTKFLQQGVFGMVRLENVCGVFTDSGIPAKAEKQLEKHNIALFKVPRDEDNQEL